MTENELRKKVVSIMTGWVGGRQGGTIHKEILKIWNDYAAKHGLPHAYESYAWCAETASAAYIKAGIGPYVPLSLSCGSLIEQAKAKGWWIENDAHKPKIADQVIYGWDAPKTGDAPGKYYHDHVGIVVSVGKDTFSVVEGNAGSPSQVRKLTRDVDFRYISGFICPDFKTIAKKLTPAKTTDKKEDAQHKSPSLDQLVTDVINNKYGKNPARKSKLDALYKKGEIAYSYDQIQDKVNAVLAKKDNKKEETKKNAAKKVTASQKAASYSTVYNRAFRTADVLHMRNGAGTDWKILTTIPMGEKVRCHGFYTNRAGTPWLYVEYEAGGTLYTGFCIRRWLK